MHSFHFCILPAPAFNLNQLRTMSSNVGAWAPNANAGLPGSLSGKPFPTYLGTASKLVREAGLFPGTALVAFDPCGDGAAHC